MPSNTNYEFSHKEPDISNLLIRSLNQEVGDAIIIGSDDIDKKRSELAAESTVLLTYRIMKNIMIDNDKF